MPKNLVVVESPAKAKTINRFLGSDFVVKASMGHIRDLPKKDLGVDVDNAFQPKYTVIKGKGALLKQLRKDASKAEFVYLAVDMDREGEAIAWHLKEALKLPDEKVRRVVFNEITKSAITRAFTTPMAIDINKVNAQQARRILDRLVGYKISQLLWKKVTKGLSAGRVQSVAVRLIVDREEEIRSFTVEEFWKLTAQLARADSDESFSAEAKKCDGEESKLSNEQEARAACAELETAAFVVSKAAVKVRKETPPPPFITSTMQQAGSTRLRLPTWKTMRLAQELYEGITIDGESVGLITYMRTDSTHMADSFVQAARKHIEAQYGPDYLPDKPRHYRPRKSAQGAHEAIRPTYTDYPPEKIKELVPKDLYQLYKLIWDRAVSCQMEQARFKVTSAEIEAGRYTFTATGRELVFDGFRRLARPQEDAETPKVPPLKEGETLQMKALEPTQHFTQPPPRYSEATLVRELEKQGIGRPSTYAPIISTIQKRGYVSVEKRLFHAAELGILVTKKLVDHFGSIVDTKFTRNVEDDLDHVEDGSRDWVALLTDFYTPFSKKLEAAERDMVKASVETGEMCPQCGKPLLERWSKRGRFLGCSGFPECRYIRDEEAEDGEEGEAEDLGLCPECESPLVKKRGRWGTFVACSGYPKCRYTKNTRQTTPPESAGRACPKCGADLLIRSGRRGRFIACSGYPKCRHTEPLPTDVVCPQEGCDGMLAPKGRGKSKTYACTKCDYTTPSLPESTSP